jgi:hypothetical protein
MSEVDKLLSRYAVPAMVPDRAVPAAEAAADAEPIEEAPLWACLRGVRERAVMLELRKRDGRVRAVSYGWMDHCDLDPSGKITLRVGGSDVTISGRNLNAEVRPNMRLFSALCRHRCVWVRESDQRESLSAGPREMVVESISWSTPGGKAPRE